MRCEPLDVEQPSVGRAASRSCSTSPTNAAFEASVRAWNIDSAANSPPMRPRRARRRGPRRPTPRPNAPSRARGARRTPRRCRRRSSSRARPAACIRRRPAGTQNRCESRTAASPVAANGTARSPRAGRPRDAPGRTSRSSLGAASGRGRGDRPRGASRPRVGAHGPEVAAVVVGRRAAPRRRRRLARRRPLRGLFAQRTGSCDPGESQACPLPQ